MKIPLDIFLYVDKGADYLRGHYLLSVVRRQLKFQLMFLGAIFASVYMIDTRLHGDIRAFRILTLGILLGFWWMCKGFPMPRFNKKEASMGEKTPLTIGGRDLVPAGVPRIRVGNYVTRDGTDVHRVLRVDEGGVLFTDTELMHPLTTVTVICVMAPKSGWTRPGKTEDNIIRRYTLIHPTPDELFTYQFHRT